MTRLEQLRLDMGLTRRELASRTDVSHDTIRKLEGGLSKSAHVRTLKNLADYFGVRPSELLDQKEKAA